MRLAGDNHTTLLGKSRNNRLRRRPYAGIAAGLAGALWGSPARAVVGGSDDPTAAIIRVSGAGEPCSGTLLSPRVVITAAHCVQQVDPSSLTIQIGDAAPWSAELAVEATWIARSYAAAGAGGGVDVALLRLVEDVPGAVPIAIDDGRPTLGVPLRLVGFGRVAPADAASAGIRRGVDVTLDGRLGDHVQYGRVGATSCLGDSGGALLHDGALVGVVSYGPTGCDGPAFAARLDGVAAHVTEVMAAWAGACVDGGCDICAFDGTCGDACEAVDLDCPVDDALGAVCTDPVACESRRCVAAPDDGTTRYCSRACVDASDCVDPIAACVAGSCAYDGGTPGIAGTPCVASTECRSGVCDLGAGACATPCGVDDACPDGLSCEPVGTGRACTVAPACGCGSAGGSSSAALVLGIAAVAARRRRR